jgi:hypothetical protein
MGINKLVFTALTVGCLAAAGLGGFFAVRYGQPVPTVAAPAPDPAAAPATATPGAVTESEGLITPAPATPPAPTAPAAAPVPAKPAPPVARKPAPADTVAVETPRARATRDTATRRASTPPESRGSDSSRPNPTPEPTQQSASNGVNSGLGTMWETRPAVEPERPPVDEEPPAPAPPPAPEFLDLEVPSDSVLGLQVERTVTSDTAKVEDKVSARVTRDVRVGARVAIPAGSVVTGSVTEVDRGGKMKGKARLAVRFHTVTLGDGSQLAIRTDAVVREGESPARETAAKVGGAAIGGAILGAILGGGRGAAIGAGVGAAGGTAASMANDRNPATLPAGTNVTVRVQQPVTVTVQKE